ncbi:MAG TPA: tetratricopeptide repeat protein [Verrucomicrobiae bacterium]|nr:tetratricopeptide repeat protein [Verrucomicrobiae bacterium]
MVRRSSLLIVLFICSFSALRAEQQWVEVSSPHFAVATDGGEKRAREVALRFEQMRIAFGVLFKKLSVETAPLQIIAFRNGKELRQFSPLYGGKPVELAGFFLGNGGQGGPGASEDRQYIALDLSQEDSWGTVFHEYSHLLINSNFPPSPVWFDEGFAEYCSSLKMDKKQIAIGLIKPELPAVLSQNRWLKLVDLFSVSHDSQIYNRDDRRSVFYAQSWLTVHFFMTKNMMKQVSAYVQMTQTGHVAVPEAIRRSFGMEPDALEKTIESYFRGGATYFSVATPPGSDVVAFNTRPLNDLEVKSVMADLDFLSRDYHQRGITEFQEILAKEPDNVAANRGLGYEAMQQNDWEKAGEYFHRAAAHDVKDPRVHYLLAMMMSRKGMSSGNKENLEAIKKELTAAIALEPGYADAYNLLGLTLSFAGETEEAVPALTKAIALSPRNLWYKGNLASTYLQAQDFEHAIPLLQELQKSTEPGIANMATQQLQQVEAYRSAVGQRGSNAGRIEVSAAPIEENEVEENEVKKPVKAPASTPAAPEKRLITGATEPVLFMKGLLVSVDCSIEPTATLTVSSAGKKWKMLAPQAKKLIVIGADELSCSWKNRKVSVNYRKSGNDQGTLVSLELE